MMEDTERYLRKLVKRGAGSPLSYSQLKALVASAQGHNAEALGLVAMSIGFPNSWTQWRLKQAVDELHATSNALHQVVEALSKIDLGHN